MASPGGSTATAPPCSNLEDLTKPALREAFASWAADHGTASMLRAHSAWASLFDFLGAEDLVEGNPMAASSKLDAIKSAPRAIEAEDPDARLLSTASTVDPGVREPWPERDLALVALFLVSGIRQGEAVELGIGSITEPAGARRLEVIGKGDKPRTDRPHPRTGPGRLPDTPSHPVPRARPRPPRHSPARRHPRTGPRRPPDQLPHRTPLHPAGIRPRIPKVPWSTPSARPSPLTPSKQGADVVELQALLGHASLDTTRTTSTPPPKASRDVVRGHPSQIALRDHLRHNPTDHADW